jgi:retron-type reverse transcriptase
MDGGFPPIPNANCGAVQFALTVPTIYDRVCQQALLNRLQPIFEPVFDGANYGYRQGRSTKDALRKVWKEIDSGSEWIVDADLKDFLETSSYCPQVHERLSNR